MIILGIDPGIETVGFGIIEEKNQHVSLIDFGCIKTSSKSTLPERLNIIQEDLQKLIDTHTPDIAGVETLFFEKNVKTAIDVAQGRGVIIATVNNNKIPIIEITPLQVKMNVTGDGRADKIQVQTMVQRILQMTSLPKPDDAADALAIALSTANFYHEKQLQHHV